MNERKSPVFYRTSSPLGPLPKKAFTRDLRDSVSLFLAGPSVCSEAFLTARRWDVRQSLGELIVIIGWFGVEGR